MALKKCAIRENGLDLSDDIVNLFSRLAEFLIGEDVKYESYNVLGKLFGYGAEL